MRHTAARPPLPSLAVAVAVAIALAALLPSCLSADRPAMPAASEAAPPPAPPTMDETATEARGEDGQGGQAKPALQRKLIKNGEVHVIVKEYTPARAAIEELVRASGGFLASTTVQHSLGEVSSATFVLRIPADRFDGVVERILRLGVVEREAISTRDVTDEYFDLQARLTNARKLERRFLDLLETQAAKMSDLLDVERELSRVREVIERFEGKLRLLDDLVGLSTLTVQVSIEARYEPPRPPTFGEDAAGALWGSLHALREAGRGLALLVIALAPWALILGIPVALLWRWRRRRKARLQAPAS